MSPILISDTGSIVIVSPPRIVGRMLAPSARKRTRQPRLKSSVTTSTNGSDPGTLFMGYFLRELEHPLIGRESQCAAGDHLADVLKRTPARRQAQGRCKTAQSSRPSGGPPPRASSPDPPR